ncbi:MAG: HIRAN domain-containing protein [Dehalococcoidia bacterium]|nr:HIRAN domain-containing protein [Dehalococcoidia bacterium]
MIRRLFGDGPSRPGRLRRVEVVGESRYQRALTRIAGGKRRESQLIRTNAELRREPDNVHDRNAVQVLIAGEVVGYLPRSEAEQYAGPLDELPDGGWPCDAEIRGGWQSEQDEGHFGVVVWLPPPGEIG